MFPRSLVCYPSSFSLWNNQEAMQALRKLSLKKPLRGSKRKTALAAPKMDGSLCQIPIGFAWDWYIYLDLVDFYGLNVAKYKPYMDLMFVSENWRTGEEFG